MKCNNCHKELEDDAGFCKYCGKKVEKHIKADNSEVEVIHKPDHLSEKENQNSNQEQVIESFKLAKTLKKKKIPIVSVFLVAILLVAVFIGTKLIPSQLDSSVNEYMTYLKQGDVREAIVLFNEKISEKPQKVEEIKTKVVEQVKNIEKSFAQGSLGYETSMTQLKHYRTFKPTRVEIDEARENIKQLNASDEFFSKGLESESVNDLEGALLYYSKVEDKHLKYQEAQNKIEAMKDDYLKTINEKADSLAKSGKYNEAIIILENGLDVFSGESSFLAKKSDYAKKQSEIKIAEQAAADAKQKEEQELKAGDFFSSSTFELTFKEAKITKEIRPDLRGYSYYDSDNDEIYLDLIFKIKNIGKFAADFEGIFKDVNAIYDGKYTYANYSEFYSIGDQIDNTWYEELDPLKTATYHLAIKLPREITNTSKQISVNLNVMGKNKVLYFR